MSLIQEDKIRSVAAMSLKKQCAHLEIELTIKEWEANSRPEIFVYENFRESGWIGTYCEGVGVGTAIKALCLDELTKASPFYGTCIDAREDACLKGVAVLSQLTSDQLNRVIKEMSEISEIKYVSAFSEICSYSFIKDFYPDITVDFAVALYAVWSKEQFKRVAVWLSEEFKHRNGWPDLTLIRGGEIKFVEVKTSDKLHYSQIVTIPNLLKVASADISVVQLRRSIAKN